MPKVPRKSCRFEVGDKVEILSTITTRFAGQHGVIFKIDASNQAHTLDKYTVRVDGQNEDTVFWDIQLKRAEELREELAS